MTKAGQEGGLSERLTAAARSWLALAAQSVRQRPHSSARRLGAGIGAADGQGAEPGLRRRGSEAPRKEQEAGLPRKQG